MKKLLLLLFLSYSVSVAHGQASLAAENIIDDIAIGDNIYTVLRDHQRPNQWYYIPPKIRLAEKTNRLGKTEPKITIIRYQHTDRATGVVTEGGLITFVFTLAVEKAVSDQLRDILSKRLKKDNIQLAAIPFNTSKITLLIPERDFVGSYDTKPTTGSTFANSEMSFSIPLTTLGADIYSALTKSTTGITLKADLTYFGVLPPCGITATGNWQNVYDYVDKNTKVEAGVGWSFLNLNAGFSKQQVSDSLKTNLGITINQMSCGTKIDSVIAQDIIKKIQDEVYSRSALDSVRKLEEMKTMLNDPKTPDATKTQLTDLIAAWSAKVGFQRVIKKVSTRKTGAINFAYTNSVRVERAARVDGALSISSYAFSEEELKNYIIDLNTGQWPAALFGLPGVEPDMGIKSMNLTIGYTLPGKPKVQDARRWTDKGGWKTIAGVESSYIQFNLLGVDRNAPVSEMDFEAVLSVVPSFGTPFTVTKTIKAFNGNAGFDAIETMVKPIKIDLSLLSFTSMTTVPSDLSFVDVTFQNGTQTANKVVTPYRNGNVIGPPEPIKTIIKLDDESFSVNVKFKPGNASAIEKSIQGRTEVIFDNSDWRQD